LHRSADGGVEEQPSRRFQAAHTEVTCRWLATLL
jgi:hypothetical protein